MNLTHNTALITGASGGIGQEFATQLAARDVHLVLVARRVDRLEHVRTDLLQRHPNLHIDIVPADLSQPGAGAKLAQKVAKTGHDIDILINNAGVGSHGRFVDEDPERVAAQIQLNIGTLVDLTARHLPAMLDRAHGLIINLASTAAFQPVATMAVYSASKAFVLSFTEALWQETRDSGVRVIALCPGPTETEFFTRTGEEFLARGRQTPAQVVTTALRALDRTTPTVIPGAKNKMSSIGYRILPRRTMVKLAAQSIKTST
jgi:short-subunit dehydrogenase